MHSWQDLSLAGLPGMVKRVAQRLQLEGDEGELTRAREEGRRSIVASVDQSETTRPLPLPPMPSDTGVAVAASPTNEKVATYLHATQAAPVAPSAPAHPDAQGAQPLMAVLPRPPRPPRPPAGALADDQYSEYSEYSTYEGTVVARIDPESGLHSRDSHLHE